MEVEGVFTPTLTPFDDDGGIDLGAYEKLLERQLAAGVHGIIPCGTTGEYHLLSNQERRQVMKFAAEKVDGHAALLAGCNATTTKEVVELGRYAKDLGYRGIMLAAPYYSLPTTAELIEHFAEVAEKTDMPIMLYNFPARTGVEVGPEVLEGLRPVGHIFGIKESSGDMARMHELMLDFTDRYQLLCGADDQALEYFVWGIKAWVAGAANILPRQHVALYDAVARDRDIGRGVEIMRKLLPIFILMEQGGKYIQYCKYGSELDGIPVGGCRAPMRGLSSAERQKFAELYELATS